MLLPFFHRVTEEKSTEAYEWDTAMRLLLHGIMFISMYKKCLYRIKALLLEFSYNC